MKFERRRQRSDHYPRALRMQLAAAAERGNFSSLVLTGKSGMLLAGTGDEGEQRELSDLMAKVIPFARKWRGAFHSRDGTRRVMLTPVPSDLGQLYLCAMTGAADTADAEIENSREGVARIISRHYPKSKKPSWRMVRRKRRTKPLKLSKPAA